MNDIWLASRVLRKVILVQHSWFINSYPHPNHSAALGHELGPNGEELREGR